MHFPAQDQGLVQSIEDAILKATDTVGKGKLMRYRYGLAMDQVNQVKEQKFVP